MSDYRPDGIYVNGIKVDDWPEWERTCPGCGRYHRRFVDVSGNAWRCVPCGWTGSFDTGRL